MPDDFKFDELDAPVQKYIKELREESARYRTERNDFRTKYESAGETLAEANKRVDEAKKTAEDFAKLGQDHSKLDESYNRLRAAAKFGISDEADRLRGKTFEEWEADAKALSEKIASKTPGVPKDPAADEPPQPPKDDPITEAFRKAGVL